MLGKQSITVLQKTIQEIEGRIADKDPSINVLGDGVVPVSVSLKQADRAIKFLVSFATRLQASGIHIAKIKDRVGFYSPDNRNCVFRLREKYHQVYAKPKKRNDEKSPAHYESFSKKFISTTYQKGMTYAYSGRFELIFDDYSSFMKSRWIETARLSLEEQIDDIIHDILAVKAKKQKADINETRRLRAQIEFYRPYVAERINQYRGKQRYEYLDEIISRFERLSLLTAWIAKAEAGKTGDLKLWPQFLDWVRQEIALQEKTVSAAYLDLELRENQLIGDVDPASVSDDDIKAAIDNCLDYELGYRDRLDWPQELLEAAFEGRDHLPYDEIK